GEVRGTGLSRPDTGAEPSSGLWAGHPLLPGRATGADGGADRAHDPAVPFARAASEPSRRVPAVASWHLCARAGAAADGVGGVGPSRCRRRHTRRKGSVMAVVIQTHGLSKRYGQLPAIDAVDLRVNHGEVYGFLGRNGAGKTTTIRTLLGMIRPSMGVVSLFGERIGPGGRGPWRRVGHLVEAPAAYPELTVRENLEIARRLYGVAEEGATKRAIERFGLAAYADQRAGTLSTGNL